MYQNRIPNKAINGDVMIKAVIQKGLKISAKKAKPIPKPYIIYLDLFFFTLFV